MTSATRQWKAAANLDLLLDSDHPPARLEKSAQDAKTRAALTPHLDARNTVDFRSTSYCGLQTVETPTCLQALCEYYRGQLQRVPLWQAFNDVTSGVAKDEPGVASGVKSEPRDDDGSLAAAGPQTGRSSFGAPLYRALGILTHVHDPSALASELQTPWELHVITDLHDDDAYLKAFQALQKDVAATVAASPTRTGVKRERSPDAHEDAPNPLLDDDDERQRAEFDGSRLSLYTRLAEPFTGVFPGMAVGVVGEPFQRSTRGVLTGVLVRRVVLPTRPQFPWRIDRPLPPSATTAAGTTMSTQRSLRIHFCSGPYPRHEVTELLRAVTTQALHRGADLLIVGGPLVLPFAPHERDVLPTLQVTFAERLESLLDLFEETLDKYYSVRPLQTRMKVVLVSHRQDVTQVPVVPTTMYAIADSDSVLVRSNPCRLSLNSIHIGVNNEDVLAEMRRTMLERWRTAEGSLRRLVEAYVQARLYTPILKLPLVTVDLRQLRCLYMDVLPDREEADHSAEGSPSEATWGTVLTHSHKREATVDGDETSLKSEQNRVKTEDQGDSSVPAASAECTHRNHNGAPGTNNRTVSPFAVENIPHILFTPSILPPFAHVTHRAVPGDSATGGAAVLQDESALDDVSNATGVLVVNQGTWSRRPGGSFAMRVAEVTIKDATVVAFRGASPATGVTCGVLHVFKDAAS